MMGFQAAANGPPLNPALALGQEAMASGCGAGWLLVKKAGIRRAPNFLSTLYFQWPCFLCGSCAI